MGRCGSDGGLKNLSLSIVVLASLTGACAMTSPQPMTASAATPVDTPLLMREALVPGLQLAVITDGRIETRSFGVADVRTDRPVTDETVFEAASLGKPLLAYAVLLLATQGRIEIDAPIGRYMEGLTGGLEALTARQLLSHTAGLPNTGSAASSTAARASSQPRFSYSGEGIRLLQRVVERVTGQPLQDYMRTAVFEPLNMTSSSFVWRDDYAVRKAFGHGPTGSSAGRSRIPQAQAASSLETTAGDYARFLLAAVRGTGLRSDLAREFLRPQVGLEQGCVVCLGEPRGAMSPHHWGLGFGLERGDGRTFAWHWGDNETMQSYAAIDSTGNRGVVILTNSANGHSIARQIASRILGVDAPGYAWVGSYGSYTEPSRRLLSRIVRNGAADLRAADLMLPPAELRQVAERLLRGERTQDALELMRLAVARGGATADDYVLLADALRRLGHYTEATAAAEAALRLAPDAPQPRTVLERIQQAQRRVPAEKLARYAGRYASPFGPLEIRSDGRNLTAHLLDQPPSEMLPLSEDTFLMEASGVPITFVVGSEGMVTHAVVRAGGEIVLPREP
jgi:CubicO group peptidase (beta-lactamase class C family)